MRSVSNAKTVDLLDIPGSASGGPSLGLVLGPFVFRHDMLPEFFMGQKFSIGYALRCVAVMDFLVSLASLGSAGCSVLNAFHRSLN